jgi:hypothetical protein
MVGPLSVNTVACGRETSAMGKASHRGHRGHRGGMEILMVGALSVNTAASGRETSAMGKASHRGHRGHGGGNGDLDGGGSLREHRGFCARNKCRS